MAKTLEQKRAEYAFKIVDKIKDKDFASEFASLVDKMPSYILTNGLGNTTAFLFSKGKAHHLLLAGLMSDWILRKTSLNQSEIIKRNDDDWIFRTDEVKKHLSEIIKKLVIEVSAYQYAVITNELLSLFVWLKRFCSVMIEKGGK